MTRSPITITEDQFDERYAALPNHCGYVVTAEPVPAGEHVRVHIAFCEELYGSRPCPPRFRIG